MILEDLHITSDIEKINKNFRKYIEQVFSEIFLKKIDRVFKTPILVEGFKQSTNVMALTSADNKIFVNTKMFNSLPTENAMIYIIHELFHAMSGFVSNLSMPMVIEEGMAEALAEEAYCRYFVNLLFALDHILCELFQHNIYIFN